MTAFEFPGEYYELIRADMRRIDDETDFLAGLLEPGGRVLDAGCGTGVNLRALSARGFGGVGVDPSTAFIARAKEAGAAANVEYVNAPIAEFATTEQFDLVVCLFATLNLLPPDEIPAFFAAARRWLRPGGRLVVEAAHLLNFVETYQPSMMTRHGGDELSVTRMARTAITPHEAIWRNEETIVVRRPDAPPEVYDNAFDQWVLTAPQLRRELRLAGFELTAEYGGYNQSPSSGRGPLIQLATRVA